MPMDLVMILLKWLEYQKGNKHLMMFIAFNFKNIICYLLGIIIIFIH